MSVAGLQEGIAQNLKVNCAGGWGPYGFFHHCDEKHGAVDIHNAIPYSCDTYYYQLGDRLGIDRIAKYATEFGYGQKTGIDLPGEQAGLMPSAQWLMKNYHRKWYPGRDTRRCDWTGRGGGDASPIGAHHWRHRLGRPPCSAACRVSRPASCSTSARHLDESFPGSGDADIPIDPENWQIDHRRHGRGDAAWRISTPRASAHLEGIDFGGKTGTAQVMSHEALDKTNKARHESECVVRGCHAARNPELVVAVLWQNGDFSYYPARIGARVVAAYVEKQRRLAQQPGSAEDSRRSPVEVSAVWIDAVGRVPEQRRHDGKAADAGTFIVDAERCEARQDATAELQRQPTSIRPKIRHASSRLGSRSKLVRRVRCRQDCRRGGSQ